MNGRQLVSELRSVWECRGMKIRHLLSNMVLLLIQAAGYAQPVWTTYNTQNSGLPENSVRAIAFDTAGGVWTGTDYGLAHFDGVTWQVYQTGTSPLPDNQVRALATAPDGALWIGTFANGLARFDGSSWTFFTTANSGLPGNQIKCLAFDAQGQLWVGTPDGLARYANGSWQTWNQFNSPLLSSHIASLAAGADSAVYIGTINGGLAEFRNNSFTLLMHSNSLLPDNSILAIALDSAGYRYFGTPSAGVAVHLHDSTWNFYSTANSSIASNTITALAFDQEQRLWAGSAEKGLLAFSQQQWSAYTLWNSPLPDSSVQALAVHPDNGSVWIGTRSGGLTRLLPDALLSDSETLASEPAFFISPNPIAHGQEVQVMSTGSDCRFSLYSITGGSHSELLTAEELAERSRQLPPGLYLIKGSSRTGSQTRKLVIW